MMITLLAGCTKEDLGAPIPYEIILEGQTSYQDQAIIPGQYLLINNELIIKLTINQSKNECISQKSTAFSSY